MLHEKAEKLKAFKVLDFGKYITSTPSVHMTRFIDNPLHASYARSLNDSNAFLYHHSSEETSHTIPSQQLHGALIPRLKHKMLRNKKVVNDQKKNILTELSKRQGVLKSNQSSKEVGKHEVAFYGSIS